MPKSPQEDELNAAVVAVRDAHPDLGILKLWAQLKTDHPEWTVGEKRFRKALSAAGGSGADASTAAKSSDSNELVAETGLDPTIDVASIAPKVKAKMFGGVKGKGLVAKAKLEEGEVAWQEEPWVACPDPTLFPHLEAGRFCTHCLAQFQEPNPRLSVRCNHCSKATFCNRLCQSRARPQASHHDLLCEGVNPGAADLKKLVATREWRSLDVVARIVARWIGERAWGAEGAADEVSQRVWEGIARVDMEKRESEKSDWSSRSDYLTRQWQAGHSALIQALNPAAGSPYFKKFNSAVISRAKGRQPSPLTEEEEQRWFGYNSFLQLLGMVNINLEDSGGLYALHAHMNHSCEPNVQVRNLPRAFVPPTNLPAPLPGRSEVRGTHKLTMLARRTIHPGDELTISYVNFNLSREERRQSLRDGYGFWCNCVKCVKEGKDEEKKKAKAQTKSEAKPSKKSEKKKDEQKDTKTDDKEAEAAREQDVQKIVETEEEIGKGIMEAARAEDGIATPSEEAVQEAAVKLAKIALADEDLDDEAVEDLL